MRNQILIFYFLRPTNYHQMGGMFGGATAFNQPIAFDTARVTSVRVYLFGVQLQWETRFWFPPFSTQLNIQMQSMFWGAAAFNQPLAFNTTEVTNVRGIYFYEALLLQLKQQILIFYFPPNSLDGRHVQRHSGLQSTTSFQYYWGYKCERHILLWSPTATIETTDSDFLFSTQFIRWATCSEAQRPSINH